LQDRYREDFFLQFVSFARLALPPDLVQPAAWRTIKRLPGGLDNPSLAAWTGFHGSREQSKGVWT